MAVDLNSAVAQASADLHNTAVQAQQSLVAVTKAAQAVTAQVERFGTILDALQADAQEAALVLKDADGKISTIQIPWLFRKK